MRRGRPFERGNKLGRGRPKGSRNKPKRPELALFREFAPHMARKLITLAMQGDHTAMRLCAERMFPVRLDSPVSMNLPATLAAQDVDKAAERVIRDMAHGKVTPGEAGKVISILEGRARIIERAQIESRIEKLEEKMSGEDVSRTG